MRHPEHLMADALSVADAYGGLGEVAAEACIRRESLYRALLAKGNPTLKTIHAALKMMRMKLSGGHGRRSRRWE